MEKHAGFLASKVFMNSFHMFPERGAGARPPPGGEPVSEGGTSVLVWSKGAQTYNWHAQ